MATLQVPEALTAAKTTPQTRATSMRAGTGWWVLPLLATMLTGALAGCGEGGPTEPKEPTPTTLSLTPTALTLTAFGETRALAATVLDENGAPLASQGPVSWTSSDPSVSVDQNGLVTPISNGASRIEATSMGLTGFSDVTVNQVVSSLSLEPSGEHDIAPGETLSVTATVADARGFPVAGASVVWTSSNPAVATVSDGVVSGVSIGTATITATVAESAVSASIGITVSQTLSGDWAGSGFQFDLVQASDGSLTGSGLVAIRAGNSILVFGLSVQGQRTGSDVTLTFSRGFNPWTFVGVVSADLNSISGVLNGADLNPDVAVAFTRRAPDSSSKSAVRSTRDLITINR